MFFRQILMSSQAIYFEMYSFWKSQSQSHSNHLISCRQPNRKFKPTTVCQPASQLDRQTDRQSHWQMTIKTAIVWANNLSNFSPGYLIFLLSSFPSRNRNLDAPSKRFYFPSFLLAFSIFFPEQSFSKMNNNNNSSLSCKSKHDTNFSFIHVCVTVFSLAFWGYSLIREWKCSIAQPRSLSLSLYIYIYIYIYMYIYIYIRLSFDSWDS